MEAKKLIILGSLIVLLAVLVVIFFRSGGEEKIKPSVEISAPEAETPLKMPGETKKVVLFFPSEEDFLLHPEEREIIANDSTAKEAKETIEELLKGSKRGYISPFPPETKLRELYITKEGVAYVDFTKEIQEKHLRGSSAEIATVFSIVNSLAYNFKSIKKVFILIDGGEKETLGGHLSLAYPFFPKYDLLAE
ncbi:MAG: GerMN domain-containing protein [Candidatus Aminicenantales bacterium]